jgi:hypothetical protein
VVDDYAAAPLSTNVSLAAVPDQAAFISAAYVAYHSAIFRYLRLRTDDDIAADLTHDVFCALVEASPRLRADDRPLLPWLYGVAPQRPSTATHAAIYASHHPPAAKGLAIGGNGHAAGSGRIPPSDGIASSVITAEVATRPARKLTTSTRAPKGPSKWSRSRAIGSSRPERQDPSRLTTLSGYRAEPGMQ